MYNSIKNKKYKKMMPKKQKELINFIQILSKSEYFDVYIPNEIVNIIIKYLNTFKFYYRIPTFPIWELKEGDILDINEVVFDSIAIDIIFSSVQFIAIENDYYFWEFVFDFKLANKYNSTKIYWSLDFLDNNIKNTQIYRDKKYSFIESQQQTTVQFYTPCNTSIVFNVDVYFEFEIMDEPELEPEKRKKICVIL